MTSILDGRRTERPRREWTAERGKEGRVGKREREGKEDSDIKEKERERWKKEDEEKGRNRGGEGEGGRERMGADLSFCLSFNPHHPHVHSFIRRIMRSVRALIETRSRGERGGGGVQQEGEEGTRVDFSVYVLPSSVFPALCLPRLLRRARR